MAVTNRNSVLYLKLHSNKYLGLPDERGGRVVPIQFKHTVVSGETGGASAGVRDTVNLCVIPAYARVAALFFTSNDVWASAAVNGTLALGDSGQFDRYMTSTELYSSGGSPIATEYTKQNMLAFAGQNYLPTADTIVLAEYRVANPVVGKIYLGYFLVVPQT